MSDYPRQKPPGLRSGFAFDRAFASFRLGVSLYGSLTYFNAFHARWERVAPSAAILAWAPPLGSHLSSQVSTVFQLVFVSLGLWYGRGWAFVLAAISGLSGCALAMLAYHTTFGVVYAGLTSLPTFVYAALRLIGAVGPPTGGWELRGRRSSHPQDVP